MKIRTNPSRHQTDQFQKFKCICYQDYPDDILDESQTGNMNIDNKFKPQVNS